MTILKFPSGDGDLLPKRIAFCVEMMEEKGFVDFAKALSSEFYQRERKMKELEEKLAEAEKRYVIGVKHGARQVLNRLKGLLDKGYRFDQVAQEISNLHGSEHFQYMLNFKYPLDK